MDGRGASGAVEADEGGGRGEGGEVARLRAEVARLQEELVGLQRKRDADRAGRTRAERELRRVLMERAAATEEGHSSGGGGAAAEEVGVVVPGRSAAVDSTPHVLAAPIKPIGVVRSPFPTRMGTPRQGMLAPSTRGWIQLDARLNPAEALDGLQQFSHVWIVFVFHQNTNATKAMMGDKGLKAKIRPPRLGGARVGLFSTRTPHRPNPIGLTIAKIERQEKGILHISGVDLVDGTPVLDIKPYLPRYDSIPDATVPDWIDDEGAAVRDSETTLKLAYKSPIRTVNWTPESEEAIKNLLSDGVFQFYKEDEEALLRSAINEVLQLDPRSAFQRSLSVTKHIKGKDRAAEAILTPDDQPASSSSSSSSSSSFKVIFDAAEVEFSYPQPESIQVVAIQRRSVSV